MKKRLLSRSVGLDPLPVLGVLAAVAMATAITLIFTWAPTERTMGIVQKIFYLHVPAAISAYVGFFICCGASVWYLIKGDVRADVLARSGAEVGVFFCLMVLGSGPLWARKAWGTFWTGEPRLLLTMVMMLIFAAYLVVREFGGRSEMTRRICAVLGILGVADIPLVRMSVARWRGNHPQVLSRGGIDDDMYVALYASAAAMALVFTTFLWLRYRIGIAEEDTNRLSRALAAAEILHEDAAIAAPAH
jgi:heme exporter protein C